MEQATKFVVGETYYGDSGDGKQEQFKVVSRTPKFITLSGNMILTTQRVKVTIEHGKESAVYAMTSWCKFVISADSAVREADNRGDTKMATKVSVKAGINEAISAVKAATTEDAIRAVLEKCTKAQMEEVFLALTGLEKEKRSQSWKKEALCNYYSARIIAYKAREAFKRMTGEEKAEYLKSDSYREDNNQLYTLLELCTPYELIALVKILGIEFEEYQVIRKEKCYLFFENILQGAITYNLHLFRLNTRANGEELKSKLSAQTMRTGIANVLKAASPSELHELARGYGLYTDGMWDTTSEEWADYIMRLHDFGIKEEVTAQKFREAFVELDKGRIAVKIPDLRVRLGWEREEFDQMLRELRDGGVIELRTGDASLMTAYEVKDCFVDENGFRMGLVTWKTTAETSYADVEAAYDKYNMAQGKYEDSRPEDEELKAVADGALNKYLDLLKAYAKKPSAEQGEVRAFLESKFGDSDWPLNRLVRLGSQTLIEMSHKAGIHADWGMSRRDMAIRLLRWSGIGCEEKTREEQNLQKVKNLHERQDSLEAEIRDKRRELLGIAEALKAIKGSRHYSGLLVLKARVEEEYRELRLESRRLRERLKEMIKSIERESYDESLAAL